MNSNSRAVAYVRMSTDGQDLSIGVQLEAIRNYSQAHHLTLGQVYADPGRSGLRFGDRPAMKQLIRDVMEDPRPFDMVLVYDVSRWGRFPDTDASAYYEYTCRLHGAEVFYVNEPFSSGDAPLSALFKSLKRAMAAEYSRELAIKSRAGQHRAVQLGYQMGNLPCLGLVRWVEGKNGQRRFLARGQRKQLQEERIVWTPGSDDEVALVRRIFDLYANSTTTVRGLVRLLNKEGVVTQDGKSFTEWKLLTLLKCVALSGDFVWGKRRGPALEALRRFDASERENAITPVVPSELWEAVQRKRESRKGVRSDPEKLLAALRVVVMAHPTATELDLKAMGVGTLTACKNAFGSVKTALALAGQDPLLLKETLKEHERQRRPIRLRMSRDFASLMRDHGMACEVRRANGTLLVDGRVRIRLQVVWAREFAGQRSWFVVKKFKPVADGVLIAQMCDEESVMQFCLLSAAQYKAMPYWLPVALPFQWRALKSAEDILAAVVEFSKRR